MVNIPFSVYKILMLEEANITAPNSSYSDICVLLLKIISFPLLDLVKIAIKFDIVLVGVIKEDSFPNYFEHNSSNKLAVGSS